MLAVSLLAALAPHAVFAAVCDGVAEWNAGTVYHAGDKLVKSSTLYQANQDIWNAPPDHPSGAPYYDNLGTCDGGDGGNAAPTVALTAPANGASFAEGSTIAIGANASDSDGSISKVEFFQGTTLLGTDTSAPYGISWTGVPAGSYAIRAVATDDGGLTATSAIVSITVTASGGGSGCHTAWSSTAVYTQGDRVTHNGRNHEAKWWTQGDNPAQSGEWGPWKDLGVCSGDDNQSPSVALTAPVHGARFNEGDSIAIAASASDNDGQIVSVEFFRGNVSLGIDTSAPYGVTWNNATAGTHALTAVATDNDGASTTSATITITVDAVPIDDDIPPSVPTGLASTAQTATSISLKWNASTDNPGGSGVAGYDVYRGGQPVGSTAQTTFTDAGLTPETAYSYRVRARDVAGNASAQSTVISASTTGAPVPGDKRVIGYFTQWGIYGRNYRVKDIDTSGAAARTTHINYAFGNVRNNRCEVGKTIASNPNTGEGGDAFADYTKAFSAAESVDGAGDTWDQSLRGNWNQLRKLKARHPQIKVLISLGGWTWSRGFSEAAKPANREAFVASCIDAYIHGNLPATDGAGGPGAAAGVFDGIDLDWEYPVACGLTCGSPEDNANFTALLAEFRRQLDAVQPGLLLTVAVGAGIDKIRVTDPGAYHPYLDFINVMTYDFHGAWDPRTNHHSALFDSPNDPSTGDQALYNSNDAIEAFIARGVPAHKLNLGIGYYGRGWTNVANVNNGLYQSGSAAPGTYEAGIEDWKVIKNKPGTEYTDASARATWKYDGNTFWSYDTPAMIAEKMQYVKAQGLGGAFFWEYSGDDAQGTLTRTISDGLAD
ncbi:glycosyl hydrolase family 18 protein [Marilutibacter alkalisoli]|uniref:glycosyl hydrolase family 18 protein n=1 Tax=Marilutibacter alkalisoli TaxID=2591633 RepID=UPI001FC96A72|nr:glycosyl hydrolase family 18 protein [Lysobacter alkalisoli]